MKLMMIVRVYKYIMQTTEINIEKVCIAKSNNNNRGMCGFIYDDCGGEHIKELFTEIEEKTIKYMKQILE